MKSIRPVALAALLTIAAPAVAEDSSEAVRAFGLIGAWSVDCSTDMSRPCDDVDRCFPRLIFRVPLQGSPVQEVISPSSVAGLAYKSSTLIGSAALLSGDKIRITTTAATQPTDAAPATLQAAGETWETVYEKTANGLRVWSAEQSGGAKIGVRDGYRYVPASGWKPEDGPVREWRRTDQQTSTLRKCAG